MIKPARTKFGLQPWCCRYRGSNGAMFGIILYASDPEQLETDMRQEFQDFAVDGRFLGSWETTWE